MRRFLNWKMSDLDLGDQILLDQILEKEDEIRKENDSELVKNLKHGVVRQTFELFLCQFGQVDKLLLKAGIAPGRVNLIGEHVDYCDGFVLPIAIPIFTVVMGRPTPDTGRLYHKIYSSHFNESFKIYPSDYQGEKEKIPSWATYILGIFTVHPPSVLLDVVVHSTIPVGSGLSSSAALELATLHLCTQLSDLAAPSYEDAALLCQRVEHEFAKVPCGIMDQFVISLALPENALKIDCRSLMYDRIPVEIVHDAYFIVTDSGVRHSLAAGEYAKRRNVVETCLKRLGVGSWRDVSVEMLKEQSASWNEEEINCSTHIVQEINRTCDAAEALLDNNIIHFGKLMNRSHESLKNLYRVSCAELDELVELARSCEGVFGSRMTGGGFGGCTVTLVRKTFVKKFKETIKEKYSGIPTFYDCIPVGGAGIVDMKFLLNQ